MLVRIVLGRALGWGGQPQLAAAVLVHFEHLSSLLITTLNTVYNAIA